VRIIIKGLISRFINSGGRFFEMEDNVSPFNFGRPRTNPTPAKALVLINNRRDVAEYFIVK
jgi:hypothetical protein